MTTTLRWLAALALTASPAAAQFTLAPLPTGLLDVGFMAAPALADLDGDGDTDVLVGRADGTVAYFENTGTATAPSFTLRTAADNPLDAVAEAAAAGLVLRDLDGTGTFDALVSETNGAIDLRVNTGTTEEPIFGDGSLLVTRATNPLAGLGDLDGDGDLDLAVGTTDGTLLYYERTGTGSTVTFTAAVTNPFAAFDVGFSAAPALLDLDGDGDLDLVVGDVNGTLSVSINSGGTATPAFGALTAGALGLADVGYGAVPAAGDLDGDGDADLLVGRSDGTLAYYQTAFSTSVTGDPGWRMLASPVPAATLADLFDSIHTQGFTGASVEGGDPTVFRYNETIGGGFNDGYEAPGAASEMAGAGIGYLAYVYEDDDVNTEGVQGGFPKTLTVDPGTIRTTAFTWGAGEDAPLSYTNTGSAADDGWNLLGNPFAALFDWDATTATGLDDAVYVYSDAASNYLAYSRGVGGGIPDGLIAAFQGFWVQATAAAPTLTAQPTMAGGGSVYRSSPPVRVSLTLRPEAGIGLSDGSRAEALLALGFPDSGMGVDASDARVLMPPANAYPVLGTRIGDVSLAVDARPRLASLTEVDLDIALVGASGGARLSWVLEGLPDDWSVTLVDRETSTETDLRAASGYTLTLAESAGLAADQTGPALRHGVETDRFVLRIGPSGLVAAEDAPARFALGLPYPNPAGDQATLSLDLPEAVLVRAQAFDALGRRVATLVDGTLAAGTRTLSLDLTDIGAGVYLVRVQAGSHVETRRLVVTR